MANLLLFINNICYNILQKEFNYGRYIYKQTTNYRFTWLRYSISQSSYNDFISDNIILKKDKIIIIHGIGTGLVRQAVHEVLSQNKYVSEYHTLNLNNGCTIAYLIIDNKQLVCYNKGNFGRYICTKVKIQQI